MSLSIRPLFESMVKRFSTVTTDDRFVDDFIDAFNDVLDELSFQASLLTAIPHVDSTSATVSELDPKHSYILRAGLVVKLMDSGQIPAGGREIYSQVLAIWTDQRSDFMVMKMREDQEDTDDNDVPLADVVGNGYQGTDTGTGVPTT